MILVKQEVETEEMISDAAALKKALKFFDANFFNDSKVIMHSIFIYDLSSYSGMVFQGNTEMFLKTIILRNNYMPSILHSI